METILIVIALLALGVGIVVWFTRKRPEATTAKLQDADTGWNDPVAPGEAAMRRDDGPADPFVHAPAPTTPVVTPAAADAPSAGSPTTRP